MAVPNPWYIDSQAIHYPAQERLLAFAAIEGQEGVLAGDHLGVQAMPTPNDQVRALPGGYSILARHSGGSFEAYVGKILIAESVSVNPVGSSGPRTDLVILRVENPYVSGAGSWPSPADTLNGPYVYVRVIEGVPANTNHVSAINNTWNAITLARITRPANTGIITQANITDLRSLAKLESQRIIIIDSPPVDPPPIAQQYWTESTPMGGNDTHIRTQTSFHNYPNEASWNIPVPAWATGFDLNALINPQIDGDVWGEFRLVMNAGSISNDPGGAVPAGYDFNYNGGPGPERSVCLIGGTVALQSGLRGKVVNMRLQARSLDSSTTHLGVLKTAPGTRCNIWINFKRNPSYSP